MIILSKRNINTTAIQNDTRFEMTKISRVFCGTVVSKFTVFFIRKK